VRISIKHIPSLDGLRALSFMLVFVAHCGLEAYVPGGLGVTVFFFLSGYLITTLMRVEFANNASINFRHFWLRRALRILPPFYLVLIAAILGALAFDPPGTLSGPAVAAQLLHVTNYWIIYHDYAGQPAGTGVYWSLAVEEHFYLLFPWLYFGMQKLKLPRFRQALLLWALCGLILLWRYLLVYHFDVWMNRTYMATDTRVDSILFGCALAVWRNPMLDELTLNVRRWKYALLPGALGILALCVLIRDPGFRETTRYSLQGIALTFIFIAAIHFPQWPPFRVLNWRPVAFVGLLSYSLYLLHFAVIFAVQRMLPGLSPLPQGVASFAVSMGLAWAIYILIEKPCARLRKALID
jgi:peptidoglycan/LPS O-acetylase OafA/YrhL